jgi:GTP-binding protein EngB required for normal cell division
VLERGDSSIASAYPKSIILVGYTRAGKSTVFNYILNKKMTGFGTKKKSYFELDQKDDDCAAELGKTFTSVTMDPNIHPCFDDKE